MPPVENVLERLEKVPAAEMVRRIRSADATGTLVFVRDEMSRRVLFHSGNVVLVQSTGPGERIGDYLVTQGVLARRELEEYLSHREEGEPIGALLIRFSVISRAGLLQALRDLTTSILGDIFGWVEGTVVFEADLLPVASEMFLSTPTPVLCHEAIRKITATGPLAAMLALAGGSFDWTAEGRERSPLVLTPQEYFVMSRFEGRPIELAAVEQVVADRSLVNRTLAALLLAGWIAPRSAPEEQLAFRSTDDATRRLVELVERMEGMDYYEFLDIPHGASQSEIKQRWEEARAAYESESGTAEYKLYRRKIIVKLDEAFAILGDPERRKGYDRMIAGGAKPAGTTGENFAQRELQRKIARVNFERAKELSEEGDTFGAIQFLEQAVAFDAENADAFWLLGLCQLRNPRWAKAAAETFQQVVSIDPSRSEAWIELGKIFVAKGLHRRAESCYVEALKYDKESEEARAGLRRARQRSEGEPPRK
jgi:curved DNA-binding protein CbpA